MPDDTISVQVLKDQQSPLRSENTLLVCAAMTSGFPLFTRVDELTGQRGGGFSETVEQVQPSPANPSGLKRQTVWLLEDAEVEFRPEFAAERISTGEFIRRYRSSEWRAENPHHPISYMAWTHETYNRLRDKLRHHKPSVMVRRGTRFAVIPASAPATERDALLALL